MSTQQFGLAALAFGGIFWLFLRLSLARLPAASFRLFNILRFRSLGTFIGGLVLKAGQLEYRASTENPAYAGSYGTLRRENPASSKSWLMTKSQALFQSALSRFPRRT